MPMPFARWCGGDPSLCSEIQRSSSSRRSAGLIGIFIKPSKTTNYNGVSLSNRHSCQSSLFKLLAGRRAILAVFAAFLCVLRASARTWFRRRSPTAEKPFIVLGVVPQPESRQSFAPVINWRNFAPGPAPDFRLPSPGALHSLFACFEWFAVKIPLLSFGFYAVKSAFPQKQKIFTETIDKVYYLAIILIIGHAPIASGRQRGGCFRASPFFDISLAMSI